MTGWLGGLRFRVVDYLRRTDSLSLLPEYLETQWNTAEQIRSIQWQLLKDLLSHAYDNVPYYRSVFESQHVTPRDIKSMVDFRALPLLTKEIIRANGTQMLARNFRSLGPAKKATGGSTGNTLSYYIDRKARSAQWAAMYRQWTIGGWKPGDRVVYLGGSSIFPSGHSIARWFYVRLNNWLLLSAFSMSDENMGKWVRRIKRENVRYMYAYASSAYLLARFADSRGIRDLPFKAVYTSAEPLYPHYRDVIQRAFKCEVYDFYGANDGGGMAFECEKHEGLHCVSERGIIEILNEDGTIAQCGEAGEVVTTDLLNYCMPFIRYKVGDQTSLLERPCSCGRGLPLISSIRGRSHDFVTNKKNEKVHGEFFSHIVRGREWIIQFCVLQPSPDSLTLFLKVNQGYPLNEIQWLKKTLEKKFSNMAIEVEVTDEMPTAPSGKYKYIINQTLRV